LTRLVFITGASSGIGQALAARYAQAGWNLALVGRRPGKIESWARAAEIAPQRWSVYEADVAQIDSIVAAGQACMRSQGLPDVVIACAGISLGVDTARREDLDVMARVISVNQLGLAATFHPFVAPMRERASGTLVGIASVAGVRGLPGHGAYCASKAGVISYCESLRGEMRSSGVRVVTLSPGFVATPLTARNRYAMPFLMRPAAFADQAFAAIASGARHRVIPWQMGWVARLLRVTPDALFDRLMVGRPRKHRYDED